jgi:hypothetical protein
MRPKSISSRKVVSHADFLKEFLNNYGEDDLTNLVSQLMAYPEDGDPVVDGFDLLRRFPWKGENAKRSLILYGLDPRNGTLALIRCSRDEDDDHRRREPDPWELIGRADRVMNLVIKVADLLSHLADFFRDGAAVVSMPADKGRGPWLLE